MSLMSIRDVTLSFGEVTLFGSVSFDIHISEKNDDKAERTALVGRNGTGKTTLFKILSGEIAADSGVVTRPKGCTVGVMEQQVLSSDGVSVYDEALSVFRELLDAEAELALLHEKLETDHSEALLHRQMLLNDKLHGSMSAVSGLTFRGFTRSCLSGLGFSGDDLEKPVSVLSGGERSRLQLAKLLLSDCGLLLLDEPTNHLDDASLNWLEQFLLSSRRAFVVISHDRFFLDKVTNRTLDLEYGTVTSYPAAYSGFLKLRREREDYIQKKYDADTEEIKRIDGIIAQQKRFNQAHNYVTIASKEKQKQRIIDELVVPLKRPASLRFNFNVAGRTGNDVLTLQRLTVSAGGHTLINGAEFEIKRCERVFLAGRNGCGKSTLFKAIVANVGFIPASRGISIAENAEAGARVRLGERVSLCYYDQQLNLSGTKDVMHEVWDDFPSEDPKHLRNLLGQFLFRGDDVFKRTDMLSGGERARVLLLKLTMSRANVLFLDEPTNHLDLPSREALEDALSVYPETLFVISHDRFFMSKLATKVLLIEGGKLTVFADYESYRAHIMSEDTAMSGETARESETAETKSDYKAAKEAERQKRLAAGREKRLLGRITELETALAELTEQMSGGLEAEQLLELSREIADTEAELAACEEEYFNIIA